MSGRARERYANFALSIGCALAIGGEAGVHGWPVLRGAFLGAALLFAVVSYDVDVNPAPPTEARDHE